MGRSGMQTFAGFLIVLSLAMLVLFNQNIAAFDWMKVTGSASSLSVGGDGLHRSGMLVGEELRRRRLQQVPTPAPAPSPEAAAGSGTYISYSALSASYVPCPPLTGRSYYTPYCVSASGPVNPYTRGCTTASSCARG